MIQLLNKSKHGYKLLCATLLLLLLLILIVSINAGFIKIPLLQVWSAFFGNDIGNQRLILFNFRLPRIVLAILIGAGIAVSGAIMQSISRNELADPGILGINAGASFSVVLYMFIFHGSSFLTGILSIFLMPFTALLGAFIAAALIYGFSRKRGKVTPIRLVLVGIGINAAFASSTMALQMKMEPQDFMKTLTWISGSIWGTNWSFVISTFLWLIILVPIAVYKSRFLDILSFGDEVSIGLGVSIEKERLKLLLIGVALAGACVSVGGGITFLGLIAPHISRALIGPNHKKVLPLSALLGSLILLGADTVGRIVMSPTEMPVGILVSILGAPYFIYLLMRTK
ncbi:FecCD family ABC transporter permease [Priestia megaterium]|uniref:FecCD family ABC transporter permease n=1 Tax=Priestia megaterium TaxID=1404 RepID=UPI00203DB378|nr:iron ABC transporter permease [Priestia megaterium]MCM3186422.1 iron ABC transporter permease [Priestia megaterium]